MVQRMRPQDSPEGVIETELNRRLSSIERHLDADCLTYFGPIDFGIEAIIRESIEQIERKRPRLAVILETDGGFAEVAERMAWAFRSHYSSVTFLVPDFAFSAGTILVMSGDAIYMNYASVLGPIDPQVRRGQAGEFVPATGYLEKYKELIEKSAEGDLTTAELFYLVQSFDPAILYRVEQERELSISLLKEWLVKYKFKDWDRTETRQIPVTDELRTARSELIATELCNTQRWHSHGRGIRMQTLRAELNLRIEDFDQDPKLGRAVREYYDLVSAYQIRRGHWTWLIHTRGRYQGHGRLAGGD